MDVSGNDCDFADGDDEDEAHDTQEAKDIVVTTFILPQALEDEQKLDEKHGEGN